MNTFEIFIMILTSGLFLGVLCLFYRMGRAHEFIESKFTSIDERFQKIEERFQKIDERFQKIDERFQKIEEKMNNQFEYTCPLQFYRSLFILQRVNF